MALKRSEKKALRERVRKFCAALIQNAEIADSWFPDEFDQESLDIIRTEMQSVAQRIDPEILNGSDA